MRLVAALVFGSMLGSSGCNFAVKHPSTTAGIVVGTLGFATCSLTTSIGEGDTSFAESGRAKCYGITAGAAVGIGLLAALAQWIGMEDPDPVTPDPTSGTSVGDPANLPPAPVFVPKEPITPPPAPVPAPAPAPEPAPEPAPVP